MWTLASATWNSNSGTSIFLFFSLEILIDVQQKQFMYTYHFIMKKFLKICVQGSRFNKVNNLHCSIKDILK